ncbi:hypothetical protein [Glaciimonas immobilis]|uniref:General stress protein 17M-like domain-containing protein n=1 Tax=Glaciimonas immobilis TaxID=728004 RepID=A0A840RPP5_9BURK|nr:hypothetical protein [Glaciimonas immobilis]KAF3999462.1 hypothetical protein HAV38_05970 [Glaciimonas immobilis]MBB5198976.1 hypothetical protein [Glaciimonas immobilis]
MSSIDPTTPVATPTSATQTVVGVFDNYLAAQRAQDALIASGFDASDVHVRMHEGHAAVTSLETQSGGVADSLRDLLAQLFGRSHEDIGHYSEAIRRGHVVVAISVVDDALVPVAQSALRNAGALDIEKQVHNWREGGYSRFDPAARPYSIEEIAAERAQIRPALVDNPDIPTGSENSDYFPSRAYPFHMAQTPYDDIMGKSGGVITGRSVADAPDNDTL